MFTRVGAGVSDTLCQWWADLQICWDETVATAAMDVCVGAFVVVSRLPRCPHAHHHQL